MERLMKVLGICVLLVCVVPAISAELFFTGDWDNQEVGSYNSSVTQAEIDTWAANTNYGAFPDTVVKAPSYTYTSTFAVPTAADTVRMQDWQGEATLNNAYAADKVTIGDCYWPDSYVSQYSNTLYSKQVIHQDNNGQTYNELQYGRNPDELPHASDALDEFGNPWGQDSYAASSTMEFYQGTSSIGKITVTNTNTQESYAGLGNLWGLTRNEILLKHASNANANPQLTIGDIALNETLTVLQIHHGTIRITGDIKDYAGENGGSAAVEGNLAINMRMDLSNTNIAANESTLEIQYAELNQIISDGQLYVRDQVGVLNFFEWYQGDQVTWGNFDSMLQIVDLDGGTLQDGMVAVYKIPEPATVSLLALGGLALLRKRK